MKGLRTSRLTTTPSFAVLQHSLSLRHPHDVDVGTCHAIADAELGGDDRGGDPGVRCAEAIDDEAVADLPGAAAQDCGGELVECGA